MKEFPAKHLINGEVAIHEGNTMEIRIGGYCVQNTYENRREIQTRINMHDDVLNLLSYINAIQNADAPAVALRNIVEKAKALSAKAESEK